MIAAISGFSLPLSLILAIGSQNAFVLKQGLKREHVFWVCLTCAVSDAVLILLGVTGLAITIQQVPWLASAMRYGGAAFLFLYGARSFYTAWKSSAVLGQAENGAAALLTCAALTWLIRTSIWIRYCSSVPSRPSSRTTRQDSPAAPCWLRWCSFLCSATAPPCCGPSSPSRSPGAYWKSWSASPCGRLRTNC
jgi:hypothetical protein